MYLPGFGFGKDGTAIVAVVIVLSLVMQKAKEYFRGKDVIKELDRSFTKAFIIVMVGGVAVSFCVALLMIFFMPYFKT